jgi:ABC-type Fe3+ transport system permease subunit
MSERKINKPTRLILSIIAGAAMAAVTFAIFIFTFFVTGLFGWADGGEEKYLRRLETTTIITFIFSIVAALVIGIFIAITINKHKRQT